MLFPLLAAVCAPAADTSEMVLRDLNGQRQQLADHRGHIMVLNFWATWCQPCAAEIPLLVALQQRYGARGVMVVGAAADDASMRGRLLRFQRKMKMNYPVWTGATIADMEKLGLGSALPATAIINRQGEIVARIPGVFDAKDLEGRIDRLLDASPLANAPAAPEVIANPLERRRLAIRGAATVPS